MTFEEAERLPWRDVFTEEQLPRGTAMIVGRTQKHGGEIATVIPLDRPEMWNAVLSSFASAMKNELVFFQNGNDPPEWFINPHREVG